MPSCEAERSSSSLQQRRSDRKIAAVDVVDENGETQQKENTVHPVGAMSLNWISGRSLPPCCKACDSRGWQSSLMAAKRHNVTPAPTSR